MAKISGDSRPPRVDKRAVTRQKDYKFSRLQVELVFRRSIFHANVERLA
jgi:hypothetical protein